MLEDYDFVIKHNLVSCVDAVLRFPIISLGAEEEQCAIVEFPTKVVVEMKEWTYRGQRGHSPLSGETSIAGSSYIAEGRTAIGLFTTRHLMHAIHHLVPAHFGQREKLWPNFVSVTLSMLTLVAKDIVSLV